MPISVTLASFRFGRAAERYRHAKRPAAVAQHVHAIRFVAASATLLVLQQMTGAALAGSGGYAAGQWTGPQQIYDRVCSACHSTNVGPSILGNDYGGGLPDLLRNGLGSMPSFRRPEVSDEELRKLEAWIAAQPPRKPTTSGVSR